MKYSNLTLTVLLGILLLGPFALVLLRGIEPYPAIILPSGANVIDVRSNFIRYEKLSIWGKPEATSSWKPLDLKEFMHPIPARYVSPLVNRAFGLDSTGAIENPDNTAETRQWFKNRLAKLGLEQDEFMVTRDRFSRNISTGETTLVKREYEKIFRLD